jgi:hypothetical protein
MEELRNVVTMVLTKTPKDLKEIAEGQNTNVLTHWLLSIVNHGVKRGDASAFNILLDRIIGKTPAFVEMTHYAGIGRPKLLPTPTGMISTAMTTTMRELQRLEGKSIQGLPLTPEEQRNLASLSKSVVELSEQERKIRKEMDLSQLSDDELLKQAQRAMRVIDVSPEDKSDQKAKG